MSQPPLVLERGSLASSPSIFRGGEVRPCPSSASDNVGRNRYLDLSIRGIVAPDVDCPDDLPRVGVNVGIVRDSELSSVPGPHSLAPTLRVSMHSERGTLPALEQEHGRGAHARGGYGHEHQLPLSQALNGERSDGELRRYVPEIVERGGYVDVWLGAGSTSEQAIRCNRGSHDTSDDEDPQKCPLSGSPIQDGGPPRRRPFHRLDVEILLFSRVDLVHVSGKVLTLDGTPTDGAFLEGCHWTKSGVPHRPENSPLNTQYTWLYSGRRVLSSVSLRLARIKASPQLTRSLVTFARLMPRT